MTREEMVAALVADNPRSPRDAVEIYVGAFLEYVTASANIEAHGSIVFHPRTGAPIENPYCKVRASAESRMLKCALKKPDRVWLAPKAPAA